VGAAHRQRRHAVTLGAFLAYVLAWCPSVFALNPSLDVNQYAHTAWKIREGFSKGVITSMAQTLDGYLWLGTDDGLLRFDGVRNVPWHPPPDQPLPSDAIRSLLAARDGTLWIATSKGLASWKNGRLTRHAAFAGAYMVALLEDRESVVWASTFGNPGGKVCAFRTTGVVCDGGIGRNVFAFYEDRTGNLWAGATYSLWRLRPDFAKYLPTPEDPDGIQGFSEEDDGSLLLGMRTGVRRLVKGKIEPYALPHATQPIYAHHMLRDRDGGLWLGTSEGLLHVHRGTTDAFTEADGLSGNYVIGMLEDREGNIWVCTTNGLDRFHDIAVPTFTERQGVSSFAVTTALAGSDGSVWIGTSDGLNRWKDERFTIYRKDQPLPDAGTESVFEDSRGRIWLPSVHALGYLENGRYVRVSDIQAGQLIAHAIVEDGQGTIWIANQEVGLLRVRGTEMRHFTWAELGHQDHATALAADRARGGLWLGFFNGGVAHFLDGQLRTPYTSANGLGEGIVTTLRLDRDGALWAATDGGLSRLKNDRIATLTSRNGLPCDSVHWAIDHDADAYWLGTACGLVRVPRSELDAWTAAVDRGQDANRPIRVSVFDASDGVISRYLPGGYTPHAAMSPDGRLWFISGDKLNVIDPRHLPFNPLPPPVRIEQLIADRKTYDVASDAVHLPPLIRDLQIDYTALSLVAPEKMRFRYKLEGHDRDWQDVGTRRQAFYNNLPPRKYRFRVIASNNSGVWNEAGAALDFSIAPAYYQTRWFEASVVLAGFAFLWAAYQVRVRRIAHEFDLRLEERVNERTRVARELHDTLLQTFHGVLFRFQAAANMLPDRPAEAKEKFDSAIDRAAQAITEGRDAIQDLRASTVVTNDLAVAITTLGDELAASVTNGNGTVVDVAVQGVPRDLHPILRDDIYRIAGEALRNAFRHAHAHRIEVEITYDDRQLRLQVRDDGQGFDPTLPAHERPGHFGLPGMRERAELVGGHLDVWSEVGVGTEIDLTIPVAKAYATARARRRAWWPAKKTGTDA
jgi:signal transduction histidine kinase/ligand-binding sensor domain-containing protein